MLRHCSALSDDTGEKRFLGDYASLHREIRALWGRKITLDYPVPINSSLGFSREIVLKHPREAGDRMSSPADAGKG